MKYLFVVSHPADAALAAGASIYIWTHFGKEVDICSLSADCPADADLPQDAAMKDTLSACADFLGVSRIYGHAFPNSGFGSVPRRDLLDAIEEAIADSRPDIVITHSPTDADKDRLLTSIACREAVRRHLRQPDSNPVKELWYMEIPSATAVTTENGFHKFSPNCYVEVGEAGIEAKLKAIRILSPSKQDDDPVALAHDKSVPPEFLRRYAATRGRAWGLRFAEAFQILST